MMEKTFPGKSLFFAATALILLFAGQTLARAEEPGSIRLLFTGGVTNHLEPSG